MAIDLKDVAEQIAGVLKANHYTVDLYDAKGQTTADPREATRFVATHDAMEDRNEAWKLLVAIRDDFSRSHIVIKSPQLPSSKDFDQVVKLVLLMRHSIARPNNLGLKWTKESDQINLKDETVNNVTESRDISKPFGSTKSSFQRVGNARLIIRHSDTVNEEVRGSRWRKIDRIFVENNQGERMRYPTIHVAGARAMARHLANEGQFHDDIGEAIKSLSEDYANLKSAAKMMRGIDAIAEDAQRVRMAMETVNGKVRKLSGPRGYSALSSTLTERELNLSSDALSETIERMMEACSCGGNADMRPAFETAARYLTMDDTSVDEAGEVTTEMDADPLPEADDDDLVHIDETIRRLMRLGGVG